MCEEVLHTIDFSEGDFLSLFIATSMRSASKSALLLCYMIRDTDIDTTSDVIT